MKINKLYAGIALASTLVLTGCGGDDDSEYVGGGDNGGPIVNNQLNYSLFDSFTEVVDDQYKRGWGKVTFEVNNNGLMQTISTIVGSSTTAYQNSTSGYKDVEYYAGKNTFITVPEGSKDKFFKVNFIDSDTFESSIQMNGSSINATYDIVTIDLNNVGKLPFSATTGIRTDLNSLSDDFNSTFPSGSECYILQETPAQPYYLFYDYNAGRDITLEEWIDDRREDSTLTDLVQENIGRDNELPAVRYTDEYGDMIGAVLYNGLVYNAYYYQKGVKTNTITDFTKNVVDCDLYNDTAADFFVTQIKANP